MSRGDLTLHRRLDGLLGQEAWPPAERERLIPLMVLFARLNAPPDPFGLFERYDMLRERFLASIEGDDPDALEEAFLTLYCHVHGHEAPYTEIERLRMDKTGGYWCHAGGLSPILKAAPYIHSHTVSGDFGAGNGLQLLLMQLLYPHRRSIQIELSSQMVEVGKHLQCWLGIPRDRVEWIAGDVFDVSPAQMDFVYLYRPVRPEGLGVAFYQGFARAVAEASHEMVIFSIADCLRDFLPSSVQMFYTDGQLTCFKKSS
ncbi:MAG: hypothetical protein QNJ97_16750 [Myxococcota bacterium]|nr:hypothetical protein [Myxococcota bacterium]